eukprot:1689078-Pyramimonas_sp.AAC.1
MSADPEAAEVADADRPRRTGGATGAAGAGSGGPAGGPRPKFGKATMPAARMAPIELTWYALPTCFTNDALVLGGGGMEGGRELRPGGRRRCRRRRRSSLLPSVVATP